MREYGKPISIYKNMSSSHTSSHMTEPYGPSWEANSKAKVPQEPPFLCHHQPGSASDGNHGTDQTIKKSLTYLEPWQHGQIHAIFAPASVRSW